jgi:dTDP-4-dehydrorhamnose reductase
LKPAKILIIGSNGQLGSDLMRAFAGQEVVGVTHAELDITDPQQVQMIVTAMQPWAVINTAAYHRTDQCEQESARAFLVNAQGPLYVAQACDRAGSRLVHISTDYVFGGHKQSPYVEDDPVAPLNVYGISKVAGELAVQTYCSKHYIIRTSGLYGLVPCRAKGENFVVKMLRSAQQKGEVAVVTDEILTPTWTGTLAKQIARLVLSDVVPFGIVHATDEGQCSWYEFAAAIFRIAAVRVWLRPASVHDFPVTVPRPRYSVLENGVLKRAQVNMLPHWREALQKYLQASCQSAVLT